MPNLNPPPTTLTTASADSEATPEQPTPSSGTGNSQEERFGRLEARVVELAESTLKAQEDFIASSQAINDLRGEIKDIAFKIDSAIRELSSKVEKSMGATKYSIGFLMATLATIIALVIRNFLGK